MPRARNIKPGFFKNEDLVELPFEDRLLFAGLWTLADRRGVLEDRPKRIKMEVFPADNIDADESLQRLHDRGLIQRYDAAGTRAIWIPQFHVHQNPHQNEKPSGIPLPEELEQGAEAPESSSDSDAGTQQGPEQHSTSTVQAPERHSASTRAAPERHQSDPAESLLLIPEVPTTSGADAPPDPKAIIFDSGLRLLTEAGGKPGPARAHLGRLCRDFGDETVAQAVRDAERLRPVEPRAYIERLCRGQSVSAAVDAATGGVAWD